MNESAMTIQSRRQSSARIIYTFSFILSACSLLYELLIAQSMAMLVNNTVIWYSLTIGTFLAALGFGVIANKLRAKKHKWHQLFQVEIILSLIGASAVILLHFSHIILLNFFSWHMNVELVYPLFYTVWFVITFLIGILTGIELPLLIDLGQSVSDDHDITNRVLGWDYLGALAAGFIFPLALVPFFSLPAIGFVISSINLLIAFYLLHRFLKQSPWLRLKKMICLVLALTLLCAFISQSKIEQYLLKRHYMHKRVQNGMTLGEFVATTKKLPIVFREKSPYQTIDLVYWPGDFNDMMTNVSSPNFNLLHFFQLSTKFNRDPNYPINYYLYLNGKWQFASNTEELYHEFLAHIPIIVNAKVPKRVLILGGGDGILHRELLKHQGIKTIDHVDIDYRLVNLAKTHPIISTINQKSLHDPRVHTILGDAFEFLRNYKGKKYDAIYMDFPVAVDYNLAKLFSREFFHFIKNSLADDGFAAFHSPEPVAMVMRQEYQWQIYDSTIRLAGFNSIIPFNARLDSPDTFVKMMMSYSEENFFIIRKDGKQGPFEYIDFDIPLDVLNENHFHYSFPDGSITSYPIQLNKVNSIFRPTLP